MLGTHLLFLIPVIKVTLILKGKAKGLTWFTPNEDQSLDSANTAKARIVGALGGRAAELFFFGSYQVTKGGSGDSQPVERMARGMVTQFGMSDVGYIVFDDGGFSGTSFFQELVTSTAPRGAVTCACSVVRPAVDE